MYRSNLKKLNGWVLNSKRTSQHRIKIKILLEIMLAHMFLNHQIHLPHFIDSTFMEISWKKTQTFLRIWAFIIMEIIPIKLDTRQVNCFIYQEVEFQVKELFL